MENWKRFLKESRDEYPEDEAPDEDDDGALRPRELDHLRSDAHKAIDDLVPGEEVEVDLDEGDIDVGDIDLGDGGIQKDIDKILGILQAQGLDHSSNPDAVTDALNYLLTDHPEDAVEYVRNNWSRIELRTAQL